MKISKDFMTMKTIYKVLRENIRKGMKKTYKLKRYTKKDWEETSQYRNKDNSKKFTTKTSKFKRKKLIC